MGNNKSRTLEIDNIEYHLSQCQELSKKSISFCKIDCPVYGPLHFVTYNGMEFYVGEAQSTSPPSQQALHLIVPPNLLVVPEFTLLEDTQPEDIDRLLQIMVGVAELCCNSEVGMGRGRIGFCNRWGIVGEKPMNWAYQAVLKDSELEGVFLSPQLMLSLSQQKLYPKHNPIKSDMFAFGLMILEIIFSERLDSVFDYAEYEIKLKPLLEKLNILRHKFGDSFYNIMLKMLELEENERIDFEELIEMIGAIRKPTRLLSSHMTASNNSKTHESNVGRSPLRKRPSAVGGYQNDCSPFKGGSFLERNNRTPDRGGRTPERSRITTQRENKSPLKRDLRINTRFEKENTTMNSNNTNSYNSSRVPFKPTLLRKQGLSPIAKR